MTARSCYWLEQERDPAVRPRTNQSGANQRVGVAPWPTSKTPYMHWARPVPIMYVISERHLYRKEHADILARTKNFLRDLHVLFVDILGIPQNPLMPVPGAS